jgi:hypothetical protein
MYGDEDLFYMKLFRVILPDLVTKKSLPDLQKIQLVWCLQGWALLQSLGERVGLYQDHINTLEC